VFTSPKIAPSILSADFMNMERDVHVIEQAGADFVHVDVMDGHFVPNLTLGVPFVKQLKSITRLPIDVHLMISNPIEELPWFLACKPDIVTVHAEALDGVDEYRKAIDMIHASGVKAALAIKPDMPSEALFEVLPSLDMVLVMSVYPGFSGQSYIEGTDRKVAEVVEAAEACGAAPLIEGDGGLGNNVATAAMAAAGCDVFVAGSAVFGTADRAEAIRSIRNCAVQAQQKRLS
jgi:ribulose-phosphate 3-epimerase